jgi:hypothetical protein
VCIRLFLCYGRVFSQLLLECAHREEGDEECGARQCLQVGVKVIEQMQHHQTTLAHSVHYCEHRRHTQETGEKAKG